MAFSQFQYPDVIAQLGLTERRVRNLFAGVPPVAPGPALAAGLPVNHALGSLAHSEFSRAVWLVGPVLADFWGRYPDGVTLNGGVEFVADPDAGLTGFVDFIIGRGPQSHVVSAPALVVFEAKRDSIPDGLGQGIAGVVGAQRFNQRRGRPVDPVYGCVTTGSVWKFLRLNGTALDLDTAEYALTEVDKLLGILTHIVGPPPG